jgi:hypothetical protein
MVWRGAWASATAYALNDVVGQAGSSYICISANTNNQPPNATYWSLVAQIGATGATGTPGENANTTTSAPFTVPAVGQTVSVTVTDAGWIVVGQMLYVDTAGGGAGLAGVLQVTAKAGNTITLLNPQPAPAIPLASSSADGLLKMVSGLATDYIRGDNTSQNLVTAIQPTIWSVRLRSWNAVGNPTFEVDQRNVGNVVPNPTGFVMDRYSVGSNGTMVIAGAQGIPPPALIPGTNFRISRNCYAATLTTQQATLGSGNYYTISQAVEGQRLRELISDIHSISILAYTNIAAGLKFGIALRDSTLSRTLTKLCTIPAPNAWTLITLPNLPVWDSGGSFPITPGNLGYSLNIVLAAGSSQMSPANNTWQAGNYLGAVGQDNFAAAPVNSYLYIAFIQHEPGAVCSTPMDLNFQDNLSSCQRYFTKSYDYVIAPGAANNNGAPTFYAAAYSHPLINVPFKCTMAKVPNMNAYSNSTGAINNVRNLTGNVDLAITGAYYVGDSGFGGFLISSAPSATWQTGFHYTADTGW